MTIVAFRSVTLTRSKTVSTSDVTMCIDFSFFSEAFLFDKELRSRILRKTSHLTNHYCNNLQTQLFEHDSSYFISFRFLLQSSAAARDMSRPAMEQLVGSFLYISKNSLSSLLLIKERAFCAATSNNLPSLSTKSYSCFL